MKPRVNKTEFQHAHGKDPRGRGLWYVKAVSGGVTSAYSFTGRMTNAVGYADKMFEKEYGYRPSEIIVLP